MLVKFIAALLSSSTTQVRDCPQIKQSEADMRREIKSKTIKRRVANVPGQAAETC